MSDLSFSLKATLWQYSGQSGWVFITLPVKQTAPIKFFSNNANRHFGSVKVLVKTGSIVWKTSLFPDKKTDCYFLPIKAEIRKKAKLLIGDEAVFDINIIS